MWGNGPKSTLRTLAQRGKPEKPHHGMGPSQGSMRDEMASY